MSDVAQVFVSATSRDLASYRRAATEVLLKLDAHPVVQDHFGPDYRSVADLLRERIGPCDAVICLVGPCYGHEPVNRSADQPRRSYTQLEYDIAVELGKPIFVFVATEDCPLDNPVNEPDELRGLQLEHLKRIAASDRIRMAFRSRDHLTDQVRLMRFDPESLAQEITSRLAVLLTAELVDPESLRTRQGEAAWVRDVLKPYHELLKRVLNRWDGTVQSESPDDCQVNFETVDAAVNAALALQHAVRIHDWGSAAPGLRVGIDVGQVLRFGSADDSHILQTSQALIVCRRLAQIGRAGQTLLTRAAFDIAREHVRQLPFPGEGTVSPLRWCSHGRYVLTGLVEPLDVCEVGVEGQAPLASPGESTGVQRADSLEERRMRGWCPAPGQEIPRRPGWFVERKLGEGGFGEVWVARHDRTRELRVFKFCFDANRLTSFKRELTLFRLLRDALGDRPDIARLLEVELDQPPFYLESEYVEGGNLRAWADSDGRLAALTLPDRLRLVAEIAKAVAAAHSVGIIHKDLKPTNIFMRQDADGRWHPLLADFGIGAVADRSQLEQRGITVAGFTQSLLEPGSSRTGTRMYQPPEANLARPATVQGDVYALGVLLYQMVIGDFDQPLGVGWERRLEAARGRFAAGGESLRSLDPTGELVLRLLRSDIGECVDGEPADRLATAAQLVERLQTTDQRVAAEIARRKAARAALRMRRLRAALAAAIAALVVVGGLGTFATMQWQRAETLKRAAELARRTATRTNSAPPETKNGPSRTNSAPPETKNGPSRTNSAPPETKNGPSRASGAPRRTLGRPGQTPKRPASRAGCRSRRSAPSPSTSRTA
jgi:serine/threonine-protein kinase